MSNNLAEFIYEKIQEKQYTGDDILELYVRYIRTKKGDRPIKSDRYGEDPPKDIKNALIETGKITKEGEWTEAAKKELEKLKKYYKMDQDVLDLRQLKRGGRRRKKKSRRRRTKKKKRRRTKKKRRRTKKKRRKRRTRRKSGGDKYITGNGKKCKIGTFTGRLRGPDSECRGPPGDGHSLCYYKDWGNDCKGAGPRSNGEDKHCVGGRCR